VTEQGRHLVHRISPDGKKKETIAGNGTTSEPINGRPATEIGLHEVRGVALRPDGSYFLCTHKGGDVIFVDSHGIANKLIDGEGRGNVHAGEGEAVSTPGDKISEPRAVTLAPNGDLIVTSGDYGFVRVVKKKTRSSDD
jgi:glucose/arabinose dehydrogenase